MPTVRTPLHLLIQTLTDSVFVVTTGDGIISMVSEGAEKTLWLAASRLVDHPFLAVFTPSYPHFSPEPVAPFINPADAFGRFVAHTLENQTGAVLTYPSGAYPTVALQCRVVALPAEPDEQLRYLIHLQPIQPAKVKHNQAKLREKQRTGAAFQLGEQERRLREAEKLANLGSWEVDLLTGSIYLSEQFFHIYEITTLQDQLPFYTNPKQGLQYVHPDDRAYVAKVIDAAFAECRDFNFKHRMITRTGNVRHIHSACFFTRDAGGKPLKAIGTIQDITEHKRRETELLQARQQAEEAALVKQQFLSVMSHEIRTPLNAVVGLTHLLLQEESLPGQLENLQMLKFSSENLLALINDVLDFSKIEAGKITFEAVDFRLPALVQNVCHSMRFKAEEKGIILQTHLDPALPGVLTGDPTRLAQVLNNLVGNAIKFTEQGTVTISTHLIQTTDAQVAVQFSVSDTGIGIAPEKISHIFESFTQAGADTTRKYGGTGLGLTITKRLLELQNSRINVTSELGKGSTFSFQLSFGKPDAITPEPEANEKPIAEALPPGVRLLLVDDNEVNQLVAGKFLNKWNIFPDVAANGQAAVEQVQKQLYDIVLMDLQMPVLNGYEATQAIRQLPHPQYRSLVIIALTADAVADVREKAMAAGVNDLLSKPFKPDDLRAVIQKHLRKQPVEAGGNAVADSPEQNSWIRFGHISELSGNDAFFREQLVTLCIRSLHEFRETFSSAVLKRNAAQAESVVHKMKQVLFMLEVQPLQEEIEQAKKLLENRRTPVAQLRASIHRVDQLCEQVIDALTGFRQ